jgi:hypothetical protein
MRRRRIRKRNHRWIMKRRSSRRLSRRVNWRTKLNKVKVLDRQIFDRGRPSHVQAFLHAVLFPSVRLLWLCILNKQVAEL